MTSTVGKNNCTLRVMEVDLVSISMNDDDRKCRSSRETERWWLFLKGDSQHSEEEKLLKFLLLLLL